MTSSPCEGVDAILLDTIGRALCGGEKLVTVVVLVDAGVASDSAVASWRAALDAVAVMVPPGTSTLMV